MASRRRVLTTLGLTAAGAAVGAMSWTRRARMPVASEEAGACAALAGGRIRWIVPHAAGGGYDAESRLLEPFLERRLNAEIVVDNLPGAGGITGARAIAGARPDGRTLGLIGIPGLFVAALIGTPEAPDPDRFTILGRISRSWHVWAVRHDSPIRTIHDAVAAARARPLVFALNEVGSVNFLSIGITARLLGAPAAMVPGFASSQAAALAALRGDVDFVCYDFEAIRDLVDAGELRPVLQVSDRPIAPHPALAGVPRLAGPEGLVTRAGADDRPARALVELVAAGRIAVGPRGLAPERAECLARAVFDSISSAELGAAASRQIDPATAADARADLAVATRDLPLLLPVVQSLLREARG